VDAQAGRRLNKTLTSLIACGALWVWPTAQAQVAPATPAPPPLTALPSLDVPGYMGIWYQVAWFPNRFQKQCVSDTAASYRQLPDGEGVEVINRCRLADGKLDTATGLARPAGSTLRGTQLEPAKLEVSFLPRLLRWLPIWGSYWVIQRADDGRYVVISEGTREYLWVLSRTPQLTPADESAIRSRLTQQGFDLARWQAHPHTATADASR
jgi:apolipoprotein D and lipocalin family protein